MINHNVRRPRRRKMSHAKMEFHLSNCHIRVRICTDSRYHNNILTGDYSRNHRHPNNTPPLLVWWDRILKNQNFSIFPECWHGNWNANLAGRSNVRFGITHEYTAGKKARNLLAIFPSQIVLHTEILLHS